jgi:hypothetical protein
MKSWIKLWFAICTSVALTACTFGNGHICGPQTPAANCDREAYQKLMYPKPYLQYWDKPAMTPEGRRQDSFECGGSRSDSRPFSRGNEEELMQPGETIWKTRERLGIEWADCMKSKSYRYTEK